MPRKTPGRTKRTSEPPVAGVRHVLTRLNNEGWRALKLLTIERELPLQALLVEAINDLLKKHGKKPVAHGPKDGKEAP
jgi:hypothetical protein